MLGSFKSFAVAVGVLFSMLVSAADGVVIGTGGETGVYFATGKVLCDLLKSKGVTCTAPSTEGSVANLRALGSGGLTLAMAQSDWQFHAYRGSSVWKGDAIPSLRAVFSVYPESVQIVANRDAGIKNWNDLKGKRINIGNPGSG